MGRYGCKLILVFCLSLISARELGAAPPDVTSGKEFKTDLTALLLQEKFDALDQALGQIHAADERDELNVTLLERAYDSIKFSPDLLPYVEKWCAHSPQQSFPWLIKGRMELMHAWSVRGGGGAQNVARNAWPSFENILADAKKCLEKAMELDPKDPDAPSHLIPVAMGLGLNRSQMEEYFKKAISIDPTYFYAYTAKIQYLSPLWQGSVEEMVAFAQSCVSNPPSHSRVYLAWGWACEEMAKFSDQGYAVFQKPEIWNVIDQVYQRALKEFNNHPRDLNRFARYAMYANKAALAQSLFKQIGGRWDKKSWQTAEAFLNQRLRAFGASGKGEERNRQLSEFLPELTALIAREPQMADYYFLRAVVSQELTNINSSPRVGDDRVTRALDDYTMVIKLDPRNEEAYLRAAYLCQNILKKPEKAVEIYDLAQANKVNSRWAYTNKGNCLYEMKQYEPALACLEKSMEISLSDINVAARASTCYYRLKRFEDGVRLAEKVRKSFGNFPRHASAVTISTGNPARDAESNVESQLRADRQGFDALYTNEACCLAGLKRDPEANARFIQTIEFVPEYAPVYQQYARFLMECPDPALRDLKKALAMAEKSLEFSYDQNPEILITLAQAYEANKRPDRAAEKYKEALKLKPGDAEIEKRLRQLGPEPVRRPL